MTEKPHIQAHHTIGILRIHEATVTAFRAWYYFNNNNFKRKA